MALPDISTLVAGTAVNWRPSGGTYALGLTSLASAAGRQGGKGDIADVDGNLPEVVLFLLQIKMAVAATSGKLLELYVGRSNDATAANNNPGSLTGADAAISTPTDIIQQLDSVGAMPLANSLSTGFQKMWFEYYPGARYLIPVVYNASDQALSGTAADHILTAVPMFRKQVD